MKEVLYDFDECEVTCDGCGKTRIVDEMDYREINAILREDGWLVKNIGGEWVEFCCINCYEKYIGK